MTRLLLPLAVLLSLATPALAQTPAQSQQALDIIKDPARRAQLISVLEAIAKAAPSPAVPSTAAPSPVAPNPAAPSPAEPAQSTLQLAPNSLGAQFIADTSSRLGRLSEDLLSTFRALTDFPLILSFLDHLVSDSWSQRMLLQTSWRLTVILALGLLAQFTVSRVLGASHTRLAAYAETIDRDPTSAAIARAEAGQTEPPFPSPLLILRRTPATLLRLVLLLLPVLAFVAVSQSLLAVGLGGEPIARLVILAIIGAYVLCRLLTTIQRAVLGPGEPSLLRLPDPSATAALRWTRRTAAIGIFGYTMAEIAQHFGLYRIAYDALVRLVLLAVFVMVSALILRHRGDVARLIRPAADATGAIARLRDRVAALWHLAAIFYLLALWMVWALDVPNGFTRLLETIVLSALVLVAARQLSAAILARIDGWISLPGTASDRIPGLDQRIGSYHPLLRLVVQIIISAAAVVVILEIWSIDAFAWFATGRAGALLVAAAASIGVTVFVGLALWEITNIAIERHLARLAREAQLARSARLRTLLPMLRTALLITICLVGGLMVLSEIGVNIAPLLAGAGVIGIAIGFGSQKLVQDVITGLFLLLENTMQVGDAVTLAGLSGSVEALSVRTIKLRALDGSVHMIPFSAVTTVTNLTRDFGYAVLEIPVSLNENPDTITEIMRDIGGNLRDELPWRDTVHADIEIFGVDKFIPNAYVITARIRTTAAGRWALRREFLRRLKQHFDAHAIDSPLTSFQALNRAPPTMIGFPETAP